MSLKSCINRIFTPIYITMIDCSDEIRFKTARSGGRGGQNVNKVETMVEARWFPDGSRHFNEEEVQLIKDRLGNQLTRSGLLQVHCSETRSQLENKHLAKLKMLKMVEKALVVTHKRKTTKVPERVRRQRQENKKKASEKKAIRRSPFD